MPVLYTCQTCKATETRSIPHWKIQCDHCEGTMTTEPSGDYSLCPYCGTIHASHVRQCSCSATMLVNAYAEEPEVNASIIKEIRQCIRAGTTTHFECTCGRVTELFRTTQSHCFCVCGELMEQSVPDLKQWRTERGWSQRLAALELEISLRSYIDIENGKRKPCAKTRESMQRIMQ